MRTKASVIIATVATLIGLADGAQVLAQRRTPPRDPKSIVLFNWLWYMGMLRGVQEIDAVATLELKATGTIGVGGQACTLTNYRVSVNYQTPGMRVQYTCTAADGQARKAIEVVSGQFAWDEDVVGAGLVPGRGTATPNQGALNERLIRLWSSPQGAPKAAVAGGDNTKVTMEGGKTVVTFPIPGVPGAEAKATLNASNQAERVETRLGSTVTEFTYEKYADYNPPDDKVEGFYAGHIVEKRDRATIRDLTVTETEVGNLYVVVPVPENVRNRSSR